MKSIYMFWDIFWYAKYHTYSVAIEWTVVQSETIIT